jgi:hypothetical protein
MAGCSARGAGLVDTHRPGSYAALPMKAVLAVAVVLLFALCRGRRPHVSAGSYALAMRAVLAASATLLLASWAAGGGTHRPASYAPPTAGRPLAVAAILLALWRGRRYSSGGVVRSAGAVRPRRRSGGAHRWGGEVPDPGVLGSYPPTGILAVRGNVARCRRRPVGPSPSASNAAPVGLRPGAHGHDVRLRRWRENGGGAGDARPGRRG